MNTSTTSAFKNLYPDVDPTQGLPLNWSERLSITFSCATLAFGAVFGDLIIVGAGLAFILFSTIAPATKNGPTDQNGSKKPLPYTAVGGKRPGLWTPTTYFYSVVLGGDHCSMHRLIFNRATD
ncbi:hypothetical protein [Corynebacterium ulcerans]|uniref:hypothetical protein n=1 Tax=Corynebacterium ulcerans TaxID=65058 RepID=UPI0002E1E7A0|nr:hypothetical protein [Corynebacterium ulcerans]